MIFLNFDLLELEIRDSYKKLYCEYVRAGKMDFKVEGAWNTEEYCRPP